MQSCYAGFACVCRKAKFLPVQEILSFKVGVFFILSEMGEFRIAFLKSGGAIGNTDYIKTSLLSRPPIFKRNFLSGFYWLKYGQFSERIIQPISLAAWQPFFVLSAALFAEASRTFYLLAFILDPEKSYWPSYLVEPSWLPQGARRRVNQFLLLLPRFSEKRCENTHPHFPPI